MEHLDPQKLQSYLDGELSGEESDAVERILAESDEANAVLMGLDRVGDFVRIHAKNVADEVDFDAMFREIEPRLVEEHPRLRLIEGAKQRQRTGFAVGAVIAIAAAVTLFFAWRSAPSEDEIAQHPMDTHREMVAQETIIEEHPPVHINPPSGSEVEDVDFGENTGTVFQVAGEEGQPLAVVWIDEEPL